jgi:hypothetical protein
MTAGEVDGYDGREELEVDATAAFARDGRRASDDKMIQNIKLNQFSASAISELVEKLRRICRICQSAKCNLFCCSTPNATRLNISRHEI